MKPVMSWSDALVKSLSSIALYACIAVCAIICIALFLGSIAAIGYMIMCIISVLPVFLSIIFIATLFVALLTVLNRYVDDNE